MVVLWLHYVLVLLWQRSGFAVGGKVVRRGGPQRILGPVAELCDTC